MIDLTLREFAVRTQQRSVILSRINFLKGY
jgi:hypothetical protein